MDGDSTACAGNEGFGGGHVVVRMIINGAIGPLLDHADRGNHIVEIHDLRGEENVVMLVVVGVVTREFEWIRDQWGWGLWPWLRWHVDMVGVERMQMWELDVYRRILVASAAFEIRKGSELRKVARVVGK